MDEDDHMWNKPRRIATYRFDRDQKGKDGVITFNNFEQYRQYAERVRKVFFN